MLTESNESRPSPRPTKLLSCQAIPYHHYYSCHHNFCHHNDHCIASIHNLYHLQQHSPLTRCMTICILFIIIILLCCSVVVLLLLCKKSKLFFSFFFSFFFFFSLTQGFFPHLYFGLQVSWK